MAFQILPLLQTAFTQSPRQEVQVTAWALPPSSGSSALCDLEDLLDFSPRLEPETPLDELVRSAGEDAQVLVIVADELAGRARLSLSTGTGIDCRAIHIYFRAGDSTPEELCSVEHTAADIERELDLKNEWMLPAVSLNAGKPWQELWQAVDLWKRGGVGALGAVATFGWFEQGFGNFAVDVRRWWHNADSESGTVPWQG